MLSHGPVEKAMHILHVTSHGLFGQELAADATPDLLRLEGLSLACLQMPDVQVATALVAVGTPVQVIRQLGLGLILVATSVAFVLQRKQ